MSGDGKSADRKLSSLSRFGLRGRGRAVPNLPAASKQSTSGATAKRTFTPKIVERSVKKEEITDSKHPQFKAKRGGSRGSGRGRGRGRGDNIIQSDGVFSHGLFSQPTLAKALCGGERFGGGGSGANGGAGAGPVMTMKMKCEEKESYVESGKVEETMDEDGKLGEMDDTDPGSLPITLPLGSKVPPTLKRDSMKLKNEMMKEEVRKESNKSDEGVKSKAEEKPKGTELADLFKAESSNGELFFFQFPDTLPIKPISQEDPVKDEEGAETVDNKDDVTSADLSDHLKRFTFRNVSEGFIGRLTVHKSGKVKMHLGNVSLDLSLGTPCGFLQDLVSVRTDREPAEMISLGHINHRLIACPDYKALLGSVTT